jgi:hypothetical protein
VSVRVGAFFTDYVGASLAGARSIRSSSRTFFADYVGTHSLALAR